MLLSLIKTPISKHIRRFFPFSAHIHQGKIYLLSDEAVLEQNKSKERNISMLIKDASKSGNPFIALSVLKKLSQMNETENIKFHEDVELNINYTGFFNIITKEAHKTDALAILNALRNLNRLGVKAGHPLITSIQRDLMWYMKSAPIHSIIKIFVESINLQDTAEGQEFYDQAKIEIQNRSTEVRSANCFAQLYEHSKHFSLELMKHIDEMLFLYIGDYSAHELVRIFHALAISGRRTTPLISQLTLGLLKNEEVLTPQQICNSFYSMSRLNIYEMPLINKLSNDLKNKIEFFKSGFEIMSILSSMGHLRLREPLLLNLLTTWIHDNFKDCSDNILIQLLITLAHVNYVPTNCDSLFYNILARLNLKNFDDYDCLIDVVWSLIVLNKPMQDLSLLINRISSKKYPSKIGSKLKLLNIYAATNLLPDFKNFNFSLEPHDLCDDIQLNEDDELCSYVNSVLSNFLPIPKYMKTNLMMPIGVQISALILYGENKKVLTLEKYLDVDNPFVKKLSTLVHKVAIMTFKYKDYTIGSQSLTGPNVMALRLLNASGYKVVEFPHWCVNTNTNGIKYINKFERMINEALN